MNKDKPDTEKKIPPTGAESVPHPVADGGKKEKRHRPWWVKVLKALGWTVASLVLLLVIILCLVAWILTPERLTPLVEKYGSEYLNADVKAGRVELTVWKSFPEVRLDIDSLVLTSRTLKGQPDSVLNRLPADAAHLLGAAKISGSINPWKMLKGEIALGDISVSGADLNLVSYNASVNNYDIVPPSEEEKKEESEPWTIRFGTISLDAPGGIRYFDAASGVNAVLHSPSVTIKSNASDPDLLYTSINSPVSLTIDGEPLLTDLPVALRGDVRWTQSPMKFETTGYSLNIAGITASLNAGLDLDKTPLLTKCNMSVDPVKLMPLMSLLPQKTLDEMAILKQIDTDASVGLKIDVATPWSLASENSPSVHVDFDVPTCHFILKDEKKDVEILHLDEISMGGAFDYNGANPELSKLNVPLFDVKGKDVNLSLTAMAEELLSDDPRLTLTSRGEADLHGFASLIPIPGAILKGTVNADASVKCHLSDLTELRYENIDADGSVEIRGLLFSLPVLTTELYARAAKFSFGNNMTAHDSGRLITGLLRAEADIDTLYFGVPGISVGLRDANLKAGTTQAMLERKGNEVAPMGMSFTAGRVTANSSTDTMNVKATNLNLNGSITRYEGKKESPLLQASVKAEKLRYTDPDMRLRTRNVDAAINAHLRERDKSKKSLYQLRYDAIAKRNPGLSADSIAKLASNPQVAASTQDVIRLDLDNGIKALFRQWGISGHVNADRMTLTHIAYPVKTTITNLGFDFSLDSLRLHRAHVQSQDNELSISGNVSNLRQMMLGSVRTPLKIRFTADVDNLDLNQIAYNFRLGQALEAKKGYLSRISPEEEDALVEAASAVPVEGESTDTVPLLVPRNIDALVKLRSKSILYDNIHLYDASTSVAMNDGAFSVDSLVASTDFGDAYMNLLYSSRDVEKMNIALDLGFSKVDIGSFMESFPQVPEMMPVITNLDGMVGARLTGSVEMFPNMDLDIASLNAVLNISGKDLTLNQDDMIRKVARMMFIRKNGPLNISDMDIQVAVHDNVLRLYPFTFGLEKYKFALLGENDLANNMYYHLSVLKSPIPFKFGINIKGTFDNPKFRFGGAKYKENEAREMVNLVEVQRVNFVKAMRLELHKLINKAALTYTDRPEYHSYNQDKEKENQSDDGQGQEFSNPVEMLSSKLKTPIINALGNNKELIEKAAAQKQAKKKK